jgi:hypothetical protein
MSEAFIVIPVHDRRDTTLACLREQRAQGVLTWAQVIVVDDCAAGAPGSRSRWWGRLPGGDACPVDVASTSWLRGTQSATS